MYTFIDGVQFYDKDEVDDLFAHNGSTALSDRLDQEVIDRTAADDALVTRIDQEADRLTQESNMRLLGDQTLTNQLTAIEQLWSTLVSANFIDTDSSTIVVDDSGKSVRQIAHDEFYRQLVTDADDVKQQLDTLKELADYLQNNPTILTDIYTKLGLTWSLDTPTDFGTFDFSRVLTATDVDSAIVELHNTLVSKVGDLTQLTTTFKGNLVGAINEVKALAGAGGGGVGGGGGADTTQLEAKLNAEIAARTQGDTDLDNRITASVGTLASLTTTAKDNLVAAVNEVKALAEAGGGGGGAGADIAQLEAELNEEVTARTQADTALGTRIDGEVTARTQADTALGTRIDGEVTARTQADTALGDRITASVGTLASLTTTAKTNLVAAVNEVQSEVNTATSTSNTNKTAIGTLSSLTTTAKDNLVAAVNEVKSEVDTKLPMYATTMLDGGLVSSAGGHISIEKFWTKLVEKYGLSAEVFFHWSADKTGYVSIDGTESTDRVALSGSTIIYRCNYAPDKAWAVFNALVIPGGTNVDVYVMTAKTIDTSGKSQVSKIYPLARASDVSAASSTANTNKTAIGTLSSLTTTAKNNLVAAVNEVKSGLNTATSTANTYRYTYVVNSNAALTAWANNDKSGGKDYTSVLIRKGTWTSSKGVNLTAAGTKAVVGEAGSKLVFNNVEKGMYYDSIPSGSDYYMHGVTVECTISGRNNSSYGFHSCTNLTNCTGTATGTGTDGCGYGFYGCSNLTNCTGTGNGDNGYAYGIHSCTNLTNCTGIGNGTDEGHGFHSCTNLTNCTGTAASVSPYTNFSRGFSHCRNLTNCTGTGNGYGTNPGNGGGTNHDAGYGYGFHSCINLTNCTGTGTITGLNGSGYGFHSCKTVFGCKAGNHCTTSVFDDCYASSTENSTYACADTANGGFNNTTNPAA